MGLVLITLADTAAAAMAQRSTCGEPSRLFIPNGAEFTIPTDVELELAPNDWEDGVWNNSGAIEVDVERAAGKGERALETAHLLVQATATRTFAGRFSAGEYARITVKKGTWRHDPGAATLVTWQGDALVARPAPVLPGCYSAYYGALRDAILGRGPNPVTAEEALRVMQLIELGIASDDQRRELSVG